LKFTIEKIEKSKINVCGFSPSELDGELTEARLQLAAQR